MIAKRKLLVGALIFLALIMIFSWQRIRVDFHKHFMVSAFKAMHDERLRDHQSDYVQQFNHNRDELTSLGYFERYVLPLAHVQPRTDEWRTLFLVVNGMVTNVADGYFLMREAPQPREIIIWARPGQRAKFQNLISAFDQESPPEQDNGQ